MARRTNEREGNQNVAPGEVELDFKKWEKKNQNSISKAITITFPKYFLFFVLSVGFCASRAPTGFAVGLTYSMIMVRIVHVYAYYFYNKILITGSIGVGAAINFLLLFTGLFHKY